MLRFEGVFMVHELRRKGLTIAEIARQNRRDRKTVRKYLERGVEQPKYGPRALRARKIDPYIDYIRTRLKACPKLTAMRLLREIRERGYPGGRSAVTEVVATIRPREATGFEHRFETAVGEQAQVDFAQFKAVFRDQPANVQVVWLFSMVLGYSRYLFGRYVLRQHLESVVSCHVAAFAEFGGVPREILYDRMKTAVLGEDDERQVRYHPTLLDLAAHHGFRPRACAPYRAKTKGKVERPFRYVREDFFLGSEFDNLAHLNAEFDRWRRDVANRRRHGTTRRVVEEAFTEERLQLQPLPGHPYTTVLRMERRLSRDGMVSVDGNQYSVPDTLTRRVVEVHRLAAELHLFDRGVLVAVHPVLEGRGQRRVLDGHRTWPAAGTDRRDPESCTELAAADVPGQRVATRSLEIYENLGKALAQAPLAAAELDRQP